jgi:urocanate hydratase
VRRRRRTGRPPLGRLLANAADVYPELVARGEHFDLVTRSDGGPRPADRDTSPPSALEEAAALRARDPKRYLELASQSIVAHCRAMCELVRMGCYVFDYGNNLRGEAYAGGLTEAFSYPGFVPAYIRPLFCRGIGPFRWAVPLGDPADIDVIDRDLQGLFPTTCSCSAGLRWAPEKVAFQGLPARICWLGYGDRARAGLAINELVRTGHVSAPVVIGRDHLDSGSVASPYRETESMRDGSTRSRTGRSSTRSSTTAAGATWVSVHHGGGVGIGNSIHSGMVVVADGHGRRPRSVSSECSRATLAPG